MPRDLADVLHYFLPELDDASEDAAPAVGTAAPPLRPGHPDRLRVRPPRNPANAPQVPPLPILGLPMGDRDLLGAALTWNLATETARQGGTARIVAPEMDRGSPLWPENPPESSTDLLDIRVTYCASEDLESLYTAAKAVATDLAATASAGGFVFVRIPLAWLVGAPGLRNPIRWLLLLSGSTPRDLDETYDLANALVRANPDCEIGLTLHGVPSIENARLAYESLEDRCKRDLSTTLISYGLLVDDLHVYRALAAGRAIGLAHPQAPASRAIADVARLLYEDARSRVLG